MQVFKFGGASIQHTERIQQIPRILQGFRDRPLLLVISAMGKTTNALEKVAEAFFAGDRERALDLFHQVKQQHLQVAKYLLVTGYLPCEARLNDLFAEAEWLLYDKPVRGYDYYYDQIVCVGELLSTTILSAYLNECGISNQWLDVRDILRTDNNFRDANIDWEICREKSDRLLKPALAESGFVITQGFIGATDENESTTLGREGSDYSAAVFSFLLDAEKLVIWKDVEGVMNADPKEFPAATLIPELSYAEVIEMAYYGAQVIHPKTIKPLQNKRIPLEVKCFLDPSLPGTRIQGKSRNQLPPIIVRKRDQVLIRLQTRDFSFVGAQPMAKLYGWLADLKLKANLVQTGAVGILVCLDHREEKLEQLAMEASNFFDVQVQKELELLSIRHYQDGQPEELTAGKKIELRQQTPDTIQLLLQP